MSLIKLFLVYVKIGAILLGGGYVILPIIINEFVEKRKLISQDEVMDYFALSQSLPGIIAANMSIFIGYKLKGKFGAVAAMFGVIFVPFWTIIILGSLLNTIIGNSYVQGFMWGIGIAVIALILLTIRETWQKSTKNILFYVIFGLSLFALLFFKLSPILTLLIFTVLGILLKDIQRRIQK